MTGAQMMLDLNVSGATTTAMTAPVFDTGATVYKRSDVTVAASTTAGAQTWKPYIVGYIAFKNKDFSGTVKLLAKDGTSAATTAATPADPDPTTAGNATTPYWYQIVPTAGGNAEFVHQSDLMSAATQKTLMDSNNNNFS